MNEEKGESRCSDCSDGESGILKCDYFIAGLDLVTVFDAILTSRQTCEKLQCLYENLMSNNFRKTAILF